jgi:LacI family transcriptional regulator
MKQKSVGIRDIAKHAGVSTGPVDKVLNNRGGVSKATRDRILLAIKELEYTPNILASRLKSTKKYFIAALLPEATDDVPYWEEHHRGIQEATQDLSPFGFVIEIFNFDQNDEISFSKQIAAILKKSYDGVFMVPIFIEETKRFIATLRQRKLPVIFFDTQMSSSNIPFIGQHSADSGYLAAEIFSKCLPQETDILIVTLTEEDDNHSHFRSRTEGFKSFFEATNTKILEYKNNTSDKEIIITEVRQYLNIYPKIRGIFVVNGIHQIANIFPPTDNYIIIGYDLIQQNLTSLKNGNIDFLISQRPYSQAYQGIKLFYEILVKKESEINTTYLPIDIVMKSNLKYYI